MTLNTRLDGNVFEFSHTARRTAVIVTYREGFGGKYMGINTDVLPQQTVLHSLIVKLDGGLLFTAKGLYCYD